MARMLRKQSSIFAEIRQHQPHLIRRNNIVGLSHENAVVQAVNEERMAAKFIIVTRQASPNLHNNKVQIMPNKHGRGLVLDVHQGAPNVLFEHGESLLGGIPIGVSETKSGKHSIRRNSKQATAEVKFSQVLADAALIFGLVAEKTLRMASIGFIPMLASVFNVEQQSIDEDGGIEQIWPPPVGLDFIQSLLLEWSICSTGADQGAFRQLLSRGHLHGEKLTPQFAMVCQSIGGPDQVQGIGWSPLQVSANRLLEGMDGVGPKLEFLQATNVFTPEEEELLEQGDELIKENDADIAKLSVDEWSEKATAAISRVVASVRTEKTFLGGVQGEFRDNTFAAKLSQHFDPTLEHVPPAALEYDWVSRYLSCEVKELHNLTTHAPRLYMGSFLTGLRAAVKDFYETDVRNIWGEAEHARECPPEYENVQLNSKTSDDFLTDGLQFLRHKELHKDRVVVKLNRTWRGIRVEIYTAHDKQELAERIIDEAWKWVEENNFLKGEAFSLSGTFLERDGDGFDDVFLAKENKEPIIKLVQNLNDKGAAMRNRGMIMMGPPGTGKTLSGRRMMNQAKATFVWISARDLFAFGVSGGLSFGFDLCRDLSPAILFVEDIDNFLHERAIDLIKTEMDGIARSSGIATILTTNYPERLPQALIDRPGRFDEILQFDLPDDTIRLTMLHRWLGGRIDQDVDGKTISKVVKKTSGYSGAHLRELCYVAIEDADENEEPVAKCLVTALDKLEAQRELIDSVQLEGGTYRGNSCCGQSVEKVEVGEQATFMSVDYDRVGELSKNIAGRVLPNENKQQELMLLEQTTDRAITFIVDAIDSKKEEVTDALTQEIDSKIACVIGQVTN